MFENSETAVTEIKKQLRKIRNDHSIEVKDVRLTKPCAGYEIGQHLVSGIDSAEIVATTENGEETIIPVFVKRLPKNEKSVQELEKFSIFKKEGNWYSKISEKMVNYCEEKSPKVAEEFKKYLAQCYYTDSKSIVILENLNKFGYKLCDFQKIPEQDINHVLLVTEFLSVFHAIGYAMEKEKLLDEFKPDLVEKAFTESADGLVCKFNEAICEPLLNLFKTGDDKASFYQNILKRYQKFANSKIAEFVKPVPPYSVLIHRDMWNNNMLFKYEDDVPVNLKVVDWQCTTIAPLTFELNIYLFSSTTPKFRKEYLEEILSLYYKSFGATVQKLLGKKTEFTDFTFSDFYNHFKCGNVTGFYLLLNILAVFYSVTTPSEGIDDEDSDGVSNAFFNMARSLGKNNEDKKEEIRQIVAEVLDELEENFNYVLK